MSATSQIELTNGYIALIDGEDHQIVSQFTWYLHRKGYAFTCRRGCKIYMHRLVLNAPDGVQVDHKNREPLDNRRDNLRFANQSQQNANRLSKLGACGYRGVTLIRYKYGQTYRAGITLNGKFISKRGFYSAEEAARGYDEMATNAWGEFAILNFTREASI